MVYNFPDRSGLPYFFKQSEASDVSRRLVDNLFDELQDAVLTQQLKFAMLSDSIEKAFRGIAEVLECDRKELLLLQHRHVRRGGQKVCLTHFRLFNNYSAFGDMLRSDIKTRFSSGWDSRYAVITGVEIAALAQPICKHFRYVIDVNSLQVFRNKQFSERPTKDRQNDGTGFTLIPFHWKVSAATVVKAIQTRQPQDQIERLEIYRGHEFVAVSKLSQIWTRFPFLLFRYSVVGGSPRLVSYSTITRQVEAVLIAREELAAEMIARYRENIRRSGTPAFEVFEKDSDASILRQVEGDDSTSRFHGEFDRFDRSCTRVKRLFSDLRLALFVNDYTVFFEESEAKAGAEIGTYIQHHPEKRAYFDRFTDCFYENTKSYRYPIIFSRASLNRWDELSDNEFLITVAHELGHWFVAEDSFNLFALCEMSHGVRWAIYTDLIEHLLVDKPYCLTRHRDHYPADTVINFEIEQIVKHGVSVLRSMAVEQGISKAQLRSMVDLLYQCIKELSSSKYRCYVPAPHLLPSQISQSNGVDVALPNSILG